MVYSSYIVKMVRWETWYANPSKQIGSIDISYLVDEKPNRVLVMEYPDMNTPVYGTGNNAGMLTHKGGITVAYEDGSAQFIAIGDPGRIPISSTNLYHKINEGMYIMRRDNYRKPYSIY